MLEGAATLSRTFERNFVVPGGICANKIGGGSNEGGDRKWENTENTQYLHDKTRRCQLLVSYSFATARREDVGIDKTS